MENKLLKKLLAMPEAQADAPKTDAWGKPMACILWGIACNTIGFGVGMLGVHAMFPLFGVVTFYVLPPLGVALLYVGLRTLSQENLWFYRAWQAEIALAVTVALWITMGIVPMVPVVSWLLNALGVLACGLWGCLLWYLRKGLLAAQEQAGVDPARDGVKRLAIWYGATAVCIWGDTFLLGLAVTPLILWYLLVIGTFWSIRHDLSDNGGVYTPYRGKLGSKATMWCWLLVYGLAAVLPSVVVNHIVVEGQAAPVITQTPARQALLQLGFPKDLLDDLPDAQVEPMSGAIYVEEKTRYQHFFAGEPNALEQEDAGSPWHNHLKVRGVHVQLPNYETYTLVQMDWEKDWLFWQDGFAAFPHEEYELVWGQLQYNRGGAALTAPIHRLKDGQLTAEEYARVLGSNQMTRGALCYPYGSTDQRAYVLFHNAEITPRLGVGVTIRYSHNYGPLQWPYAHAENRAKTCGEAQTVDMRFTLQEESEK